MQNIGEKLKEYFDSKGITQKEIADRLGVSKAYVNALFNGRNSFGKGQAEKWVNLYGLSKSWLLTGEGEMFTNKQAVIGTHNTTTQTDGNHNTTTNYTTNNNYRGCDGGYIEAKKNISDMRDRITALEEDRGVGDVIARALTNDAIPYYGDLLVSAGEGNLAEVAASHTPTGWIDIPGIPKSIGALPVIGCSMEPDIKNGDYITIADIDSWEKVDPDKIYLIITHDERMIKRLCTDGEDDSILWCISPNYPSFKIYKSDIVSIYRVTFYGRRA